MSAPADRVPVVYLRHGTFFVQAAAGATSLATPIWAAIIALANQRLRETNQPSIGIDELHAILYNGLLRTGLEDITVGTRAHPGWDTATGWGSPKAGIVDRLVEAVLRYRQSH